MRLAQISTAMAALALGAAVVLYVRVERLARDLGPARAAPRDAGTGPAAPEVALERPRDGSRGVRGQEAGMDRATPAETVSAASPRAAAAGSLEERIARLEEQQRASERGTPWREHAQRHVRSMDDLAGRLSLTPTQRARVEDIVGRGRQRIEDLLKIPDETGKSPHERRAEARKKLEEAMKNPQPGGVLAFATDLMSYRGRKIPGRNETYGDEIERIRKETRDEISSALDTKQQETLAQTNVDALLGEAGQVSFAYSIGDAGEGGEAGMIVEMGADVVTEEAPAGGGK